MKILTSLTKLALKAVRDKALELHQAGWSYSRIANYFGVSKSTVFNWIHDYPYKGK